MKFLLHSILFMILAAPLLAARGQGRTYDVVTADVPFRFNIGSRTFRSGHYQFVLVGPGLLALRDAKAHTVASLFARPIDTSEPSGVTRLIFDTHEKHARLAEIRLAGRSQVLVVLGEELALRPSPAQTPALPGDSFSFSGRSGVPRLKQ